MNLSVVHWHDDIHSFKLAATSLHDDLPTSAPRTSHTTTATSRYNVDALALSNWRLSPIALSHIGFCPCAMTSRAMSSTARSNRRYVFHLRRGVVVVLKFIHPTLGGTAFAAVGLRCSRCSTAASAGLAIAPSSSRSLGYRRGRSSRAFNTFTSGTAST